MWLVTLELFVIILTKCIIYTFITFIRFDKRTRKDRRDWRVQKVDQRIKVFASYFHFPNPEKTNRQRMDRRMNGWMDERMSALLNGWKLYKHVNLTLPCFKAAARLNEVALTLKSFQSCSDDSVYMERRFRQRRLWFPTHTHTEGISTDRSWFPHCTKHNLHLPIILLLQTFTSCHRQSLISRRDEDEPHWRPDSKVRPRWPRRDPEAVR